MKKILFILISICLFTSCCYNEGTKKVSTVEGIGGEIYVKEFTYKGHTYIEFKDKGLDGQGYVHDPDCQECLNKFD